MKNAIIVNGKFTLVPEGTPAFIIEVPSFVATTLNFAIPADATLEDGWKPEKGEEGGWKLLDSSGAPLDVKVTLLADGDEPADSFKSVEWSGELPDGDVWVAADLYAISDNVVIEEPVKEKIENGVVSVLKDGDEITYRDEDGEEFGYSEWLSLVTEADAPAEEEGTQPEQTEPEQTE